MPHLPVVQEGHGGAVALVPVVGVAGLWLLTGIALLGLVDCPTQLDFYGLTVFAAGRNGEWNKCEKLDEKNASAEPQIFFAYLHIEPGECCTLSRCSRGTSGPPAPFRAAVG